MAKRKDQFAAERRRRILELLREEGSARVTALSTAFAVSEPTIRQDLERLEAGGHVIREHGGVFLRSVTEQVRTLSLEHCENIDKKAQVGACAAGLIVDGDRIIIDSGSTNTELAKRLNGFENLTVITNSLNISLILGSQRGVHVLVTGGEFKPPTLSLTGEKAAAFFHDMHVDRLFLATGGISDRFELTYPGFADLAVKRAMIAAATTVYVVADSTKIGKAAFASLGPITCARYLITDDGISPALVAQFEARGVQVLVGGMQEDCGDFADQ